MMGATSAQAYASWARKNHVEVLTDELPEGAKLHWIGPRREDNVMLYFHGAHTIIFFSKPNSIALNVGGGGHFRRWISSSG